MLDAIELRQADEAEWAARSRELQRTGTQMNAEEETTLNG
jgi:hypothetical protein